MPENIIMIEEDRSFINKAKKYMQKNKQKLDDFRNNYKKDFVDTGKSQELERKIDQRAKMAKKTIKAVGTLATVILMFIPADGPFGELCTALATPALCSLVSLATDIQKKMLITGKRGIEKHFLKVDGKDGNISAYNLDNGEIIEDFGALAKETKNIYKSRGL